MYDYLSKFGEYECMWLTYNLPFNKKNLFLKLRVITNFFKAKHIFTTHDNLIRIARKNQNYYSLWHGMPLKKMGFMENNLEKKDLPKYQYKKDLMIATSTLTKALLASCFHLEANKIHVTGQPRNDYLFNNPNDSKNKLEIILNKKVEKYDYIVFYLPTFRKGYINREEGRKINELDLFRFNGSPYFEIFLNFLQKNNILFLMKFHPLEEEYYQKLFDSISQEHLEIIPQSKLIENYIDLYEILGYSDMLITDYSSVYFDYLLLDKPIIFVANDIEEYSKNRGFLLEPYNFWTPGFKADSIEELMNKIFQSLNNNGLYSKERNLINNIINHFQDNKSCERVWQLIESEFL
jgi:CDP-glycerol glycerophosphotransferase (TagB/SpsB family)